jgi:hypothetical protein
MFGASRVRFQNSLVGITLDIIRSISFAKGLIWQKYVISPPKGGAECVAVCTWKGNAAFVGAFSRTASVRFVSGEAFCCVLIVDHGGPQIRWTDAGTGSIYGFHGRSGSSIQPFLVTVWMTMIRRNIHVHFSRQTVRVIA